MPDFRLTSTMILAAALLVGAAGCETETSPFKRLDAAAGPGGAGGSGGAGGVPADAAGGQGGADAGRDATADGAGSDAVAADVRADLLPADGASDARADLGASTDAGAPDTGVPDAAPPDVAAAPDAAAPDVALPDVAVDAAALDAAADLAPDAAPDAAADLSPDVATMPFMALDPCPQEGSYVTAPLTISFFAGPNGYSPSCLMVPKGTKVTFIGDFGSHPLRPRAGGTGGAPSLTANAGSNGEFTFNEAGFFPYTCNIHPSMIGVIWVLP
jgi:plastocyanin